MNLTSFDVETRGTDEGYALQPFRLLTGHAWLTMCAMASGNVTSDEAWIEGQIRPDAEYLREWLKRMATTGTTICGWNVPFDMAWLIAMGLRDEVYACNWLDGMLLWRHLTASPEWTGLAPKSYGLKAAVAEFYPAYAGYGDDIQFDTDDVGDLLRLFQYNKTDARFTLLLVQSFLSKMPTRMKRNALIEAACLPLVAETYIQGIVVNTPAAQALSEKLTADANVAMVTLKVTEGEKVSPEVLASPMKLRKLLYDDWGLTPPKYTDKGAESTDRDALSLLAGTDPRATLLNDYREAKNNKTKFADGVQVSAEYNGDGCGRPSAKVNGTYTGRMTYSGSILKGKAKKPTGFPLHQFKRTPEFRNLLTVPDGYTMLEFDFSGQEYRWMAVLSGDSTMLKMCAVGEDAHGYMGAQIGNVSYTSMLSSLAAGDAASKSLRQLGKLANLGLGYRTSAPTLVRVARVQHKLILSESEARAIHATYRTTYPDVMKYWRNQIDFGRMNGYVETVAGRQVQLGKGNTWNSNKWGLESTAINFPVQGTGADQKYLALCVLRSLLPKFDGKFYFELHDSVNLLVPDKYAEQAVHEIKHALSNLPYKQAWGVDLPIQFPVDAKMGKSWGGLKEVK